MRPELFFPACSYRHAVLASQQFGFCVLSFPTAPVGEWEMLVKLSGDKGAEHGRSIQSHHCSPIGTLAGLLDSNTNCMRDLQVGGKDFSPS